MAPASTGAILYTVSIFYIVFHKICKSFVKAHSLVAISAEMCYNRFISTENPDEHIRKPLRCSAEKRELVS